MQAQVLNTAVQAFRWLSPERHPLPTRLTRDDVWHDRGRWSARDSCSRTRWPSRWTRARVPGALTWDVASGSRRCFWRPRMGRRVVSLDLWVSAEERRRAAAAAGVADRITPLQGDIRRGLPRDGPPVDAIFCLQAFHTFGAHRGLLRIS